MPGKLAFSQPVVIKWECEHHDADIHVHSSECIARRVRGGSTSNDVAKRTGITSC